MDLNNIGELIIAATAGGSALGTVFAWRKTKAEAADIVGRASDRAVARAMAAMDKSLGRLEADLKNALARLDICESDRKLLHQQNQRQAGEIQELQGIVERRGLT